jgi:hypothetical protein
MVDRLKTQDLEILEVMLNFGTPSYVYEILSVRGYKYAVLADSVVKQNSLMGNSAINFMKLSAQSTGRILSAEELDGIYRKMARGYLDALHAQLQNQGAVTRDINHQEAWAIHNKAFIESGLTPDTWTLNSVFSVMGSDAIREAYWGEVLASAGDPIGDILMAAQTQTFMATASVVGTPHVKAIADSWRARVDSPSTIIAAGRGASGMVAERINTVFNTISNNVFGMPSAFFGPPSTPVPGPVSIPAPTSIAPPPSVPRPPKRRSSGRRVPPPTTRHNGHPGGSGPVGNTGPRLTIGN